MAETDTSTLATTAGGQASALGIEAEALTSGELVAQRYRVVRQLGQDPLGVSVLVEDQIWGEEIVLKFLHRQIASHEADVQTFIHELRDARKIVHENILNMYDVLLLGSSHVLSLEHFVGHTLTEELQRGALSVRRGMKIVWDVCRGLQAAHHVPLIHQDLTPDRVLLNYTGDVKIVRNFTVVQDGATSPGLADAALLHAPTYLAPEHIRRGTLDVCTNIYSLGVIMYEMFTGTPPYVADDPMTLLLQHVEGNPVPPRQRCPTLPPELEALILKAMAVEPAQRLQSADELRRGLAALSRAMPG